MALNAVETSSTANKKSAAALGVVGRFFVVVVFRNSSFGDDSERRASVRRRKCNVSSIKRAKRVEWRDKKERKVCKFYSPLAAQAPYI
jgi:hypothetical protein